MVVFHGVTRYFVASIALFIVAKSYGGSISVNSYNAYKQLEQAMVDGNTSSIPNLDILRDTFFPKRTPEPLCAVVKYTIEDTLSGNFSSVNHSFLWTTSYLPYTTSVLLLSYSQSGIALKGFEWERSCLFRDETLLLLSLSSFNYSSNVLVAALGDLTSQLKAYADAGPNPKASSDYRGYALNWDSSERELDRMNVVFTVQIILLNIFIVTSALASTNFLYKRLYENIKDKANPGYAFFWAIVFLSIVWNVAPSWLVLSRYGFKVYFSLAIVIPLQLFVAILVKKQPKFPIPGSWCANHSDQCIDDISSASGGIFRCLRCAFSHVVQVLSIWSLLITFTFFVHYLTSVIVSLYLDPLNSLVKLAFLKAIIVCFIITTALFFVVDTMKFRCTRDALQKVTLSFVSLVSLFSALPILLVFLIMIGGIVFDEPPSQSNSWRPIFTLIPSLLLLFASWFSHGILFPKGRKDKGDPLKEIEDDLEGNTAGSAPTGDVAKTGAHTQIPMNEATPLLPHPSPHSND